MYCLSQIAPKRRLMSPRRRGGDCGLRYHLSEPMSISSVSPSPLPTEAKHQTGKPFTRDVAIVGGCGHVGLPLGIALARQGLTVTLVDTNQKVVDQVNSATLPFAESDAAEPLQKVVSSQRLVASCDASGISSAEHVIVVIGTPVDEHLNPDHQGVPMAINTFRDTLVDGQHMVLRSTVYPGVTRLVERQLVEAGLTIDVSFCPERIAEGKAMTELFSLPQIISGRTPRAVSRARALFSHLTQNIIELTPEEAELAKLFTNTWRYIKFAAANQLFMIANDFGLDFERIRHAVTWEYPRAADLPGAGFAAGPCLFKDTMQLAAFNNNNFTLGHASMLVNEGLPLYVVARLERRYDLSTMSVGILGMAFKGESDDTRSSLSYKLKRVLKFKAREVLCTDPHVRTDPSLLPLSEVIDQASILIIAAPHHQYRTLEVQTPVVDLFNVLKRGVKV